MYDVRNHRADVQALELEYQHQLETASHWLGIDVLPGWLPIVRQLFGSLDRQLTPFEKQRIRLSQIKQKWGQLRVHYHLDGELARLHADIATPEAIVHIVEGVGDLLMAKVDALIKSHR